MNLATLPDEILYEISFYLDELTIWWCVREINQRMCALFSDPVYWQVRLFRKWGLKYDLDEVEIYLRSR
jgi:hypothetical protein